MGFRDLIRFFCAIHILVCLQTCYSQTITLCKIGECIDSSTCNILRPAIRLLTFTGATNYSRDIIIKHRCGEEQNESICCSDLLVDLIGNDIKDSNSTAIIVGHLMAIMCLQAPKIFGNGVNADIFDFPWMALLKFENNVTKERKFLCGGSLINDRYVLTAAHCFTISDARLVNVRLGEYDTSTEIDCDPLQRDECTPPFQELEAEEVIQHQDFKAGLVLNDIALIRLKEKAVYGVRVFPICLPIIKNSRVNINFAQVAGWGLTISGYASNILQTIDMPVLSNEVCAKRFPRNFSPSQICAGGIKGVDTCRGDSGGPLFATNYGYYVQYGILSGGGRVCGGNNTVPSIYTNVVNYLPWIIENMKL